MPQSDVPNLADTYMHTAPSVKVLHLNVRLVQDDKGEYLKGIKRRVFEVFKDDLGWQTGSGAFKTVDCKKVNQVKLRA